MQRRVYSLDQNGHVPGVDSINWRAACRPIGYIDKHGSNSTSHSMRNWRVKPSPPSQLNENVGNGASRAMAQIKDPMLPTSQYIHNDGVYFQREEFDLGGFISRNLIVNYLPWSFLEKHLQDMFEPYGPLHSVKVMRNPCGKSCGYGFANYIRIEDAVVALHATNGRTVLECKRLKVSFARPPSGDIQDTNVFITGLPLNTTSESLVDMFRKFGGIVQKTVLHDKQTGFPLGKAFIRFAYRNEAAEAIRQMDGIIAPGGWKHLSVKLYNHEERQATHLARFRNVPPPQGAHLH